jgi:hypothetical protein
MWQKYTKLIGLFLKCLGKEPNEMVLEMAETQKELIVLQHKIVVNQISDQIFGILMDRYELQITEEQKNKFLEQAISNIAIVDKEAKYALEVVGTVVSAMQTETTKTTEDNE